MSMLKYYRADDMAQLAKISLDGVVTRHEQRRQKVCIRNREGGMIVFHQVYWVL